jgi:hypothetical protein
MPFARSLARATDDSLQAELRCHSGLVVDATGLPAIDATTREVLIADWLEEGVMSTPALALRWFSPSAEEPRRTFSLVSRGEFFAMLSLAELRYTQEECVDARSRRLDVRLTGLPGNAHDWIALAPDGAPLRAFDASIAESSASPATFFATTTAVVPASRLLI